MFSTARERLILMAPVPVIGFLAIVPAIEDGPTVCAFALGTGMACPGCGMTRAAAWMMRGDFTTAISLHPLVPAIGLLAATAWVWFLLRKTGRAQPMSNRTLNAVLITTLVALIAVWIARLATGTLPPV